MIYEGAPSRLLPELVTAIHERLAARVRCMYMNSPAMVAGVRSLLYAAGTDVAHEVTRGALVLASDQGHLANGRFDGERMLHTLEAATDQAVADGYEGLFATGDMTWEFGPEKDFSRLLDYEWGLEQLFRRNQALSGICQYHRDLLPREAVREALVSHGTLFINATLTRINPHYVQARSAAERRAAAGPALDDALEELVS